MMTADNTSASKGDKVFTFINYLLVTIFFLIVLYPLIYIVSASFSSGIAVITGQVKLLPVEFNIRGYQAVFNHKLIMSGYANSLIYMSAGTIINVSMTILAGYPLSRKDFYGRSIFMMMFVFTMLFSGGMIPSYLLVRSLGLLNTRLAMIIPGAMSVYNVIITKTYFQTSIPNELLEATKLDGGSDFKFVTSIVLPLSGPIIAVLSLFYAIGHWNSFFSALIYLRDARLFPLQLILRDVLISNQFDTSMLDSDILAAIRREELTELLKYSLIVVASFPVMMIYPFVQKYFVKGMMIGSLKG